jgi:hypothetical protein
MSIATLIGRHFLCTGSLIEKCGLGWAAPRSAADHHTADAKQHCSPSTRRRTPKCPLGKRIVSFVANRAVIVIARNFRVSN